MQYTFNKGYLIQNSEGCITFFETYKEIHNFKQIQNLTFITKLPLLNKEIFSCLKKPIDAIIITESFITQLIIKKCKLKRIVWLVDLNIIYQYLLLKRYTEVKKIKDICHKLNSNFLIISTNLDIFPTKANLDFLLC